MQDTYARVLAKPRFLRNDDDLGYLLQVLRNTFLTQLATRRRRAQTIDTPIDEIELASPRTGEQPQAAAEANEVYTAIAALPDDFRDVIVAVDVAGLSYKEAAAALKTRTGTVMSRLHRARERVSVALAESAGPPGRE